MPELPEAEANRRRIERDCLNRTIEAVTLSDDVEYIDLPGDNERGRLVGRQFTETRRHGKLIFAGSAAGPWIVVHLGMTGELYAFDEGEREPPDYTKLLIAFEGTRRLAYRCPRKLGWVRVIDDPDAFLNDEGWGPDALGIERDVFRAVIGGTNGAVKSALMAQKKVAGIGNLWSDEMLYRTGIAPDRNANELEDAQIDALFDAMHEVLNAVSDTDADYAQLPNDWIIHHREDGGACPKCDGTIRKSKVGGRSAFACDSHQT
ncbi:Formamidopyrimidine-DNA glycosylase [Rhodobacteraceae bacterium THAF1]|uniref:Fpg/Nei family DNA glycosylase n=1 Tax=Palleronia sp. THAF1 TaxID=2587842 RepID=UPI000F3CCD8A|nr:DNA-formamidopyrimidine glycosylase family protein [Palleronia sp. THAF1]QFU10038.1 Formamidopyrimidine-DNA glycosylase [Palleronia sp. THAF1]VDC17057.1 Formamidopyrimidine-DNA glycosylase [Rhodobacteraceae bacterium THAF1]